MRAASASRYPNIFHFKSSTGKGKSASALLGSKSNAGQAMGWKAGNELRRSLDNCSQNVITDEEEVSHLEKEVFFALRYFQDVVEKNTLELLAGSTTVVIENIFVLDNKLQSLFHEQNPSSATLRSELIEMHRYLAVLVRWSDEVLIWKTDRSTPMRRHPNVVPAIYALRRHVHNAVEIYYSNTKETDDGVKPFIKLKPSASTESLFARKLSRQSSTVSTGRDEIDGAGSLAQLHTFSPMSRGDARQSHHSTSSYSLHSRSPSPQLEVFEKTATDSGISLDGPACIDSPRNQPGLSTFARKMARSDVNVASDNFSKPPASPAKSTTSLNGQRPGVFVYEVKRTNNPFIEQHFFHENGLGVATRPSSSQPLQFLPLAQSPLSPSPRRTSLDEDNGRTHNHYEHIYCEVESQRGPPLPPKKQRNVQSYIEVFGHDSFATSTRRPSAPSGLLAQEINAFKQNEKCHYYGISPMSSSPVSPINPSFGSKPPISPRNGSNSSPRCSPIPYGDLFANRLNGSASSIPELDHADNLIFCTNALGKNEVKGGTVDALITEATKSTKKDFLFQEAFLGTYRTFISAEDLVKNILRRYAAVSSKSGVNEKNTARTTFFLLLRIVDELCLPELFKSPIIHTLLAFVYQLVLEGDLAMARGLRRKLLDKHDCLQKSRSTSLLLLSTPRRSRRIGYLLDFKSVEIAEQMTLLDAELFTRIDTREILLWTKEQSEESGQNLSVFTEHFNKISFWARTRILEQTDNRDREKYFVKFLKIMKHLRKIQNFNSYLALLAAVDSAPIRRLDCSKAHTEVVKEFSALIDSSQSFRIYRSVLAGIEPPCIPYIGIALQDLTFVNENPDWLDENKHVVNFGKRWQQHQILDLLRFFQKKCQYPFLRNETIVQFFNNFDNFLPEEQLWQISEFIKPRGTTKA
ncbi:rap guanine nucleotide exchange factor 1-like [Paramacrobiotus metropolitanus]|uniref:rap guanine nucleotide exchange factor 1-like n=1 Tax=Paramacrobiotus metropolitanus TaxID=2943436 RepID=UPI0024460235|nr:rap guanine nucleotide exchange factor 1-like [Paramacrobiotus metropolitanus]XP_055331742.1 rap guanine nucleotide exchange factor 1-like [Paramacrobiotus metropolitanus]XP_055331743.1 rap guanine nucleotide exchange factor 1-like [Paramacrobiotus metropolitanus]XP_055331744.1 rap guanine nucleotide exchange factor 1-like [Paramacrobiotus metropolitanus]